VCLYEMANGPLPYTFEPYLDAQSRKLMKDKGAKSLNELEPFERSQVADGCLERRIKNGRLLEMTPPRPYLSARLAKIIRKATAIKSTYRYQDAFEFHSALQAFSAPNWIIASSTEFTAESWKGWDWKATYLTNASPKSWIVSRARQGNAKYRAFGSRHLSSKLAFKSVEDFV